MHLFLFQGQDVSEQASLHGSFATCVNAVLLWEVFPRGCALPCSKCVEAHDFRLRRVADAVPGTESISWDDDEMTEMRELGSSLVL